MGACEDVEMTTKMQRGTEPRFHDDPRFTIHRGSVKEVLANPLGLVDSRERSEEGHVSLT